MELRDDWTWAGARTFLPLDLEGLARETGLWVRRRGTDSVEALTRLLLLCAIPKASLAQVADWGRETGLCRMNASAVFFRLRDSERFLSECLASVLSHLARIPARRFGSYRLLALDGTFLCGPGAKGTDQLLHVAYDLGACAPRWVDATTSKQGEGLARHASRLKKGDLVLADRGYGRAKGLLAALESGASLLVRFEFSHLRLMDAGTGEVLSPAKAAERLSAWGWADLSVRLPGWERPLRALGSRNEEGEPVWLLTDLPADELAPEEARSLYALRWQVELFFKRLKSLLDLDEIPTRDGPTARPWILAKLTLAALAVLLGHERFSPWRDPIQSVGVEAVPKRTLESPPRPARDPRNQSPSQEKRAEKAQAILPLEA